MLEQNPNQEKHYYVLKTKNKRKLLTTDIRFFTIKYTREEYWF